MDAVKDGDASAAAIADPREAVAAMCLGKAGGDPRAALVLMAEAMLGLAGLLRQAEHDTSPGYIRRAPVPRG